MKLKKPKLLKINPKYLGLKCEQCNSVDDGNGFCIKGHKMGYAFGLGMMDYILKK